MMEKEEQVGGPGRWWSPAYGLYGCHGREYKRLVSLYFLTVASKRCSSVPLSLLQVPHVADSTSDVKKKPNSIS